MQLRALCYVALAFAILCCCIKTFTKMLWALVFDRFCDIITRPTEIHRFSIVSGIASTTRLGDASSTQIILEQRIND